MTKQRSTKRNALGKGLGALLKDNDTTSADALGKKTIKVNNLYDIDVKDIETNPYQPRDYFDQEALQELAESIKLHGIIQPITVRKLTDTSFQLISGERRFQASQLAGLTKVPAYVRTANDQQMLEMALIENIQRENLNAIEVALSYQRLLSECDLKQEELGDRVGKKRATVNNYLRLLKLPPDIQTGIRDNRITMGHARALVTIEDVDVQLSVFNKTIEEGLSVRKVEEIVRTLIKGEVLEKEEKPDPETKKENKELAPEFKDLQTKLSSHFGTKISVSNNSKNKGEIKIPYVSIEDLNRILEILNP